MVYETTILLLPQLGSEKTLSLWEKLVKEIEGTGGKIEKEIKPFEKKLAYPIKKNGLNINRALMGILYLTPSQEPPVFTKILSEFLRAHEAILRFMVSRFHTIPAERTRSSRQSGFLPSSVKTQHKEPFETTSNEEKNEKPVKEEIDKKIEEILEDKISF